MIRVTLTATTFKSFIFVIVRYKRSENGVFQLFDLLLLNGRVVDGLGNPWFKADIGIKNSKITAIGELKGSKADCKIDVDGNIVCPGFIDMHSHSDLMLLANSRAEPKIMQGVTTELIGQDGLSAAPISEEYKVMWRKHLSGLLGNPDIDWDWNTFGDYLKRLEDKTPAVNIAALVPHGNLRLLSMEGIEDREANEEEIRRMEALLEQSYREGAFGISTGLIYPPCSYADYRELLHLAKITAKVGGFFVFHIRNEGDGLLESLQEVISIGKESGAPIHISHFKALGKKNWGKVKEALGLLEEARKNGLDVTCDQYPYIAGSTMLSSIIPDWAHAGGSETLLERLKSKAFRERLKRELKDLEWDLRMISYCKTEKNEGKFISEIAESENKHPVDVICDLLIDENLEVSMINFYGCEEDVKYVMRNHLQMFCTDGLLPGKPHPRVYGTYPRVLGRYVRGMSVLRLEEAIRKMTSLPAQRLSLIHI